MKKTTKPIFFENSRVPALLSKFSPIEIGAITLFPFVFSRQTMGETIRNHETIHFQQQLETGIVGFYIIYVLNYLWLRFKGLDGPEAYMNLLAEKEAYAHEWDADYLLKRKRYQWLKGANDA